MKNMADAIESFIVGQLLAASKNTVLVQRNELADVDAYDQPGVEAYKRIMKAELAKA